MTYEDFLVGKTKGAEAVGKTPAPIHDVLFPFQAKIVKWAIRRGRAAIFADCGMGKTLMQLEWARQMGDRVLIVTPLCVAEQTVEEAKVLGMSVRKVARPVSGCPGYFVTNYEKLKHFVDEDYDAIVLDESSILKSIDGKTRSLLLSEFSHIPYRLCCTATPAPNDIAEMGNHAQFLGVMRDAEMKATFFVHDDQHWRLKGHAQEEFYRWMASWCVYVRRPSDIGESDDGFSLPPLIIEDHIVSADYKPEGLLFALPVGGIQGRHEARRETIAERVSETSRLVAGYDQWLVWCGLNDEGRQLKKALGEDAVLIEGADSESVKIERVATWMRGDVRVLISKPSIFGFGMNFQHCHKMAFLGLGDSWETYYQAIRRCWRFGQKSPVEAHIIISQAEEAVARNIQRKEKQAQTIAGEVIRNMGDLEREELEGGDVRSTDAPVDTEEDSVGRWKIMLGDCVERIRDVGNESVGLSVFSPPFASLYTYSNSERDMGNAKDYDEFFGHFRYLIPELLRVTIPGRRACVHVQQVATKKAVDGVIGWLDFRADVVREFVDAGWVYDGEVVIDKDPQAQAIRTKSKALLFAQMRRDSSWSRPAMADYILLFRHPGENPCPVQSDIDNETWIQWARPIWYGIRENDTLHVAEAREEKDERHICPLQLETIERCIRLWSNPGDMVLDPFGGIGSTGYQAVKLQRRATCIELKPSYFNCAVKNLKAASAPTLFDVKVTA